MSLVMYDGVVQKRTGSEPRVSTHTAEIRSLDRYALPTYRGEETMGYRFPPPRVTQVDA